MIKRNILCIDLKSFYASCECVERKIDPFTTPLVVANPNQGNGAITLAVTPYLKAQGIKGRTRLYEIPKNISYFIVPPRMSLYIKRSKEVLSIYLDYISEEDMHVYSIDEVFLDVTNYLHLYKMSDYELAETILKNIETKTGLTATCGIGPNLLLAKIAMDIEAKKYKNGICKWTYEDIEKKLWSISPLSKVWGIGVRMEKRLNALGIFSIGDLAHYDKQKLKSKFGIMGEELWNHANGIDESVIADWKIPPKEKSISHSQVLFKDYNGSNIRIIIEEMVDVLTARLRSDKKECFVIGLGIGFSKTMGGGFYHNNKLDTSTDSPKEILQHVLLMFDRYYENQPIRKVSISLSGLVEKKSKQLNIFENVEIREKEEDFLSVVDTIKDKFGKNSVLKASSLLADSTIIERNGKIGGHRA